VGGTYLTYKREGQAGVVHNIQKNRETNIKAKMKKVCCILP